MNRWAWSQLRRIALGVMGLGALGMFARVGRVAEPPLPPQASAEDLQSWLAELDSDSYEAREAAAQRLAEVGPAAIDVLSRGLTSDSAEIAWRSGAALERIAVSGDEATLARVTGVLDGLSTKGKPGLRSMAAEMHVRQKRFRHDRAVASLKQNGAVFSDGAVELGAGGMFIGGGPVAIAIDAMPFEGPAIVEGVPAIIEDGPALIPEIEAPDDAGIFGLLRRALGGAIEVKRESPPALDIEDDRPVRPAPDLPPPTEIPVLPAESKPVEPAPILEESPPVSEAPAEEAVPVPRAEEATPVEVADEPAPPPEAQVIEAPVEIIEAPGPAILMDFDFVGGGIIGIDEGEVQTTAALALGPQWLGGDDGLKILKDVPEIWSISVNGAKITDESLQYMAELPSLSSLSVRQTNITRKGLQKLRGQKPDLQIQARGEAMMGVNGETGVAPLVLTSVFPDSGAYRAGLRQGDVVSAVDGVSIKEFTDLTISVYGRKPGEKIRVEYEREGTKKTAEVTLTKRGADQ